MSPGYIDVPSRYHYISLCGTLYPRYVVVSQFEIYLFIHSFFLSFNVLLGG